jgi:hypothetical protein
MSEVKVNKISPRSGTTVTLGDSGDTFTIPSGATINNQGTATNFGATGSASWTTTVKTNSDSGFTAVAGEGYFLNTTSGTISVNLPAGTPGAVVAFKDYLGTFDTNAVTLVQNGSDKIGGSTVNATLDVEGIAVTLVFIDSTQGWLVTDSGLQDEAPTAQYITATGGTITNDGNFKVHTFTGPGTFTVCSVGNAAGSNEVSYMVVAGGAGAGGDSGGAGGAGGFREGKTPQCTYTQSPIACTSGSNNGLPVTATGYPVTVGGGGSAGTGAPPSGSPTRGGDGSPSTFAGTTSITSTGGGGGGSRPSVNGGPGGSGGGARTQAGSAGAGNTPPVSPAQGFDGAGATPTPGGNSGGGGGATALGVYAPDCSAGGPGGAGATTSINGTPTAFAGGGGGGGSTSPENVGGTGGAGGGGNGSQGAAPATGNSGTANTGGGGGGGGDDATGGAGGSGIVIIRYKFQT